MLTAPLFLFPSSPAQELRTLVQRLAVGVLAAYTLNEADRPAGVVARVSRVSLSELEVDTRGAIVLAPGGALTCAVPAGDADMAVLARTAEIGRAHV